ncbi:hypothetical protein C8R42DRAFT_184175 [Lentinula raphanica]|nr:hypothetical protein C8R42DRAFT_184175 [Lentinula raphanica]
MTSGHQGAQPSNNTGVFGHPGLRLPTPASSQSGATPSQNTPSQGPNRPGATGGREEAQSSAGANGGSEVGAATAGANPGQSQNGNGEGDAPSAKDPVLEAAEKEIAELRQQLAALRGPGASAADKDRLFLEQDELEVAKESAAVSVAPKKKTRAVILPKVIPGHKASPLGLLWHSFVARG